MRTQGASNWAPEREEQLRTLWVDGWSASRIAKIMGGGLTRNSIIGKAHRMGLAARRPAPVKGRSKAERARQLAREKVKQRVQKAKDTPHKRARTGWIEPKRSRLGFSAGPAIPLPPPRKINAEAWIPLEGTAPVSLTDLERGQCKWPVTEDSPFLFCGAPADHGPYCQHHHLWSIGQGTSFERSAVEVAEYEARMEQMVFDPAREAA